VCGGREKPKSLCVIAGRDPAIHAVCSIFILPLIAKHGSEAAWMPWSSHGMTEQEFFGTRFRWMQASANQRSGKKLRFIL